jgi:hypothetical protein
MIKNKIKQSHRPTQLCSMLIMGSHGFTNGSLLLYTTKNVVVLQNDNLTQSDDNDPYLFTIFQLVIVIKGFKYSWLSCKKIIYIFSKNTRPTRGLMKFQELI